MTSRTVGYALIALLGVAPFLMPEGGREFLMSFAARIIILAIAVMSLDLILGYGGMLSLGHAAFIGTGGYAVGALAFYGLTNGWAHFAVAVLGSGAVAFLMGLVALRTSGVYFLMITLALTQLLYYIGMGMAQFGGDDGMQVRRSAFWDGVALDNMWVLYYLAWTVLGAVAVLGFRLVDSRFGMALQGIRSNERRMLAIGFRTFRYKLAAFVLAGVVCGIAGALFVNLKGFLSPVYMHWSRSGELLVMVLLGGTGTLVGPIVGAAVYQTLELYLPDLLEHLKSGQGRNWHLVFGPLLIVVALVFKGGILGWLADRRRRPAPAVCSAPAGADALRRPRPGALLLEGLCKRFGGVTASDRIRLDLAPGELHAVIGPNGAGKTTLVAQISGELTPDEGRIVFEGRDITRVPVQERAQLGIARSYQITSIFPEFSALENVMLAVQSRSRAPMGVWRRAAGDPELECDAYAALAIVDLAERAAVTASELAHGEQRRLEMAMALALRPGVLLLDEPMAGVGTEESAQLVEAIRRLRGRYTVLLIEHDMDAVFSLADRITVLDGGRVIACGTPEQVRQDHAVQQAYLGTPS